MKEHVKVRLRKYWERQKTGLKVCPFCGENAELISIPDYFTQGISPVGWIVQCKKRCCEQSRVYVSDHDAIEAWNRRATDVGTD